MTEIQIIKIIFGILLFLGGTVLIILSYVSGYRYLVQEKRCTAKVSGTIKKYTLGSRGGSSGIHLPVVYYVVDGVEYKRIGPEYKGYVQITKKGFATQNSMNYEEKNQVFYIHRNMNSVIGAAKNPIQELYPLDSQIDVYYDPGNPKLSYVLRYCNNKWVFWLMFLTGAVLWIVDVMIQIFL
ncbi:MAG: DUF3592 domain-containing protein [Clostridia bacterium]|nr:hypothetical protein [Lachnospiraceae bacterium]NCB99129.1 DUF3592 domain-containing protein [Clostridia bacterium]NCD02185.1 DUF3592 domain-containing protein [Clostridia bacterium]